MGLTDNDPSDDYRLIPVMLFTRARRITFDLGITNDHPISGARTTR